MAHHSATSPPELIFPKYSSSKLRIEQEVSDLSGALYKPRASAAHTASGPHVLQIGMLLL